MSTASTTRTALSGWLALLLAIGLVLSACGGSSGGGDDGDAVEATSTTAETSAGGDAADPASSGEDGANGENGGAPDSSPGPAAPPPGTQGGDAGAAGGAPGSVGPRADADEPEARLDIDVEFASDCVRPGTPQRITIRTAPNTGVAYHAVYSDGTNGFDEGYFGGNNAGETDGRGEYQDSWVVGADAPPGEVKVDIVALSGEGRGYLQATFEVSGVTGRCS